jgi:enhancing lycopene biosynthesis protein 2
MDQFHVVNHHEGKPSGEKRNVLTEAARIVRGQIKPLSDYCEQDFDALIFPGGFGVAKNLCTWAIEGDQCTVYPEVERAVMKTFEAKKPIGAMCIAPVILARLFHGSQFTTGQDPVSGKFIENTGNRYVQTGHGEVVTDPVRKLFTTPCYMLDATISQVAAGTENIVTAMLRAI